MIILMPNPASDNLTFHQVETAISKHIFDKPRNWRTYALLV
jgi:hypothetical protein